MRVCIIRKASEFASITAKNETLKFQDLSLVSVDRIDREFVAAFYGSVSLIFKKAATATTAHSQSSTLSVAEERALRQSWNAALDAAHFGSLESMESNASNSLRRSSSWKDKM